MSDECARSVVMTLQPDVIGLLESLEELRLDCNDLQHLPPVSTHARTHTHMDTNTCTCIWTYT